VKCDDTEKAKDIVKRDHDVKKLLIVAEIACSSIMLDLVFEREISRLKARASTSETQL
jgi:hypothetical protein